MTIYSDMHSESFFAGQNAYRYIALYYGVGVFYADTGTMASYVYHIFVHYDNVNNLLYARYADYV